MPRFTLRRLSHSVNGCQASLQPLDRKFRRPTTAVPRTVGIPTYPEVMVTTRWAAMSGLIVADVVAVSTLVAIKTAIPNWLFLVFGLVLAAGIVIGFITLEGSDEGGPAVDGEAEHLTNARRGSAFIRGNLRNSSVVNVRTEADVFVDGDAQESHIENIDHRPPPADNRP